MERAPTLSTEVIDPDEPNNQPGHDETQQTEPGTQGPDWQSPQEGPPEPEPDSDDTGGAPAPRHEAPDDRHRAAAIGNSAARAAINEYAGFRGGPRNPSTARHPRFNAHRGIGILPVLVAARS
jgi:hypothetical protein